MRCFTWIASRDRFLSDHTIDYPVADSQSQKLTTIYTLILKERTNNWDILWLALLAKCIYLFSFVIRCQFTPLLTKKLWDPPLLFTPIPSKSSYWLTSYLDNRLFTVPQRSLSSQSCWRTQIYRWSIVIANQSTGIMEWARQSQNETIFSCPRDPLTICRFSVKLSAHVKP